MKIIGSCMVHVIFHKAIIYKYIYFLYSHISQLIIYCSLINHANDNYSQQTCIILLCSLYVSGSLGSSVFDMKAYLAGASGGVYSLLAAHLANIMLNYSEMEFGLLKLSAVLIIASADVGFAVWDRLLERDLLPHISYTAHLMGSLAGLTMGLLVLKNFDQKLYKQCAWWIAFAVYAGCTAFAVCWNVFYF